MTKGKHVGERGLSAPGILQVPSALRALCSAPLKERKGIDRLREAKHPHKKLFSLCLISLLIKSEMLLNEFYLLSPKSVLGVLGEKAPPFLAGNSGRVRGCPFARVPQSPL